MIVIFFSLYIYFKSNWFKFGKNIKMNSYEKYTWIGIQNNINNTHTKIKNCANKFKIFDIIITIKNIKLSHASIFLHSHSERYNNTWEFYATCIKTVFDHNIKIIFPDRQNDLWMQNKQKIYLKIYSKIDLR